MRQPRYILIAGPNGAGKSTLSRARRYHDVVDPDAIARRLDPTTPDAVSVQAGREALRIIDTRLRAGVDVAQETTLSGRQPLSAALRARTLGYAVHVSFVAVSSPQLSAARVAARVARGGHDIPQEALRRRFDRALIHLSEVAAIADRLEIFDNSGLSPRLVHVRRRDATLLDEAPDWLRSLINRLAPFRPYTERE